MKRALANLTWWAHTAVQRGLLESGREILSILKSDRSLALLG